MATGPGQFQRPRPGVFEAPADDGGPATPQVRRVHISAGVTLLMGVPWLLFSIAILIVVFSSVYETDDTSRYYTLLIAFLVVFLLSGGLAFVRPVEHAIARVVFRLHRPDGAEKRRVDHAWSSVTTSAGVAPHTYRLWIQDSAELNAFATAGHTVAVTRAALELPPNHLAAVLAHELGHHLGGHSWAKSLAYWYSIPARIVTTAWAWINRTIFNLLESFIGLFAWVFWALWMLFLAAFSYALHPVLLAVFAMPFVLAWFNRHGETYADRVAADLGYGRPLLEVLHGWSKSGHASTRKDRGWWATLLSDHPSRQARIKALQRRVSDRKPGGST